MTEWSKVRLGDMCEHVTVGHVGKMTDQYCDEGVLFLRSQDVRPFSLALSTAMRINRAFHMKLRKSSLRPGDVVVVRTGYPGTAAVVPSGVDEANCADLVIIRPGPDLDGRLIASYFNSSLGRSVVGGRLVGSAQQHFNVRVAADLVILVPDRMTQSRIGDVLDSFNELIENNRRRIEILEETARSLYREWFVRYRFPGSESAEFVDSAVGKVPAGWTVTSLGEQLDFVMGQSPSSVHYNEEAVGLPFHQGVGSYGRRYPRHQRWTSQWTRQAESGDVLVSVRAPVGRLNVADQRLALGRGLAAVRPRDSLSSYWFEALRHIFREEDAFGGGTIFKAVTRADLLRIEHVLPAEQTRREFDLYVRPLAELDQLLDEQIRRVEAARDLLLPRLVTGKIEVDSLGVDDIFGWIDLASESEMAVSS